MRGGRQKAGMLLCATVLLCERPTNWNSAAQCSVAWPAKPSVQRSAARTWLHAAARLPGHVPLQPPTVAQLL